MQRAVAGGGPGPLGLQGPPRSVKISPVNIQDEPGDPTSQNVTRTRIMSRFHPQAVEPLRRDDFRKVGMVVDDDNDDNDDNDSDDVDDDVSGSGDGDSRGGVSNKQQQQQQQQQQE
ncbi:hypothetical protein HZH68_003499 [Vespula germanica]|uniref:Uncharacterized protein n=1 Tax=Vespula germanica TaxID=30212 RepID=A0A834NPI8_VESGE|nr:hypothetical protein HZH68_003499 [Vespula germanica]